MFGPTLTYNIRVTNLINYFLSLRYGRNGTYEEVRGGKWAYDLNEKRITKVNISVYNN